MLWKISCPLELFKKGPIWKKVDFFDSHLHLVKNWHFDLTYNPETSSIWRVRNVITNLILNLSGGLSKESFDSFISGKDLREPNRY